MKVYVVTCYVEGCYECSNTYHIVGVCKSKKKAEELIEYHNKNNDHIHKNGCVEMEEFNVI